MKAAGRFVEIVDGSYVSKKDGSTVPQVEIKVLTDESELVVARASGADNCAAARALVSKLAPMDPIVLPVDRARDFGGVLVWSIKV